MYTFKKYQKPEILQNHLNLGGKILQEKRLN